MEKEEKKEKRDAVFKRISSILYVVCFIFLIALLGVVALQRFSNNTISLGGFRIFNVATTSMVPKYEVGDILIAKTVDVNELKVGDDVVYMGNQGDFDGKIVTHQLVRIDEPNAQGELKFHTKGIANDIEDPTISGDQIYGVIVYKVWTLSFISKIINNMFTFYFVIFIPIAIIIYLKIKEMRRTISDDDEEEEEKEDEEKRKEIVKKLQEEKEQKEAKEENEKPKKGKKDI